MDRPSVRRLEEIATTLWPPARRVVYDGWIIGVSDGQTRRANCVLPLYPGELPVGEKARRCEALFRDAGLPSCFKLTSGSEPPELDGFLQQRGYVVEAETAVQMRALGHADCLEAVPPPGDIRVVADLGTGRLADYGRLNGLSDDAAAKTERIMRRIPGGVVLAWGHAGSGETVACCALAREDGCALVFGIAVDPSARGRGWGTAVTAHALLHARSSGAHLAFLQVDVHNAPALRVYHRLGFREAYRYWYRVLPAPDTGTEASRRERPG